MTDYVKSTNFASKDSLSSGNPLKIVKGTEIDTEFNNIATAVGTKADLNAPTFTGNVTGTFVGNVTGNVSGTAANVTGTVAVANGGTGATSFTSGALLKGAGTGAVAAASAADIVGQIGATAVQNATNATTATTATTVSNRAITGIKIARLSDLGTLTVSAADTYTLNIGLTASGSLSTASTSYQTIYTITIDKFTGSIRFLINQLSAFDSEGYYSGVSYLRILKNGSQITEWTLGSSAAVLRTSDVSIVPGDVITYQMKVQYSLNNTGATSPLQKASDGYGVVYPIGKFSENS